VNTVVNLELCFSDHTFRTNGIAIAGDLVLLTLHPFAGKQADPFDVEVTYDGFKDGRCSLMKRLNNIKVVWASSDHDLAVIRLSLGYTFKEIGRGKKCKFITEADLAELGRPRVVIPKINHTLRETWVEHGYVEEINVSQNYFCENREYPGHKLIQHSVSTTPGDCGYPLCVPSLAHKAHIIGIHCARDSHQNRGFAQIVTAELIAKIRDDIGQANHRPGQPVLAEALLMRHPLANHLPVIGKVSPKAPPLATKTKLRHSLLWGVFDNHKRWSVNVMKGPAVLVAPAYKNALTKLCYRADREYTNFPEYKRVIDRLAMIYPDTYDARLLTLQEAIAGVVGLPPINMQTSPGYPWSCSENKKGKPGKTAYFVKEGDEYVPVKILLDAINEILEEAVIGVRSVHLFTPAIKDELRALAKVLAQKSRIFDACPLPFLLIFRMYFGDIIRYIQHRPSKNPVSIGVNAHGIQWAELMERIRHAILIQDGDHRAYDGRVYMEVSMLWLEWINRWYRSGPTWRAVDDVVRRTLFEELFNTLHVWGELVYCTLDGNPSGQPFTAVKNSLDNFIMLLVSTIRQAMDEGKDFDELDWDALLYGDDFLSLLQTILDAAGVAGHLWDDFGMEVTNADKSGPMESTPADRVTFLQRRFVRRDGIVHAPLPLETIAQGVYWTRDKTGDLSTLQQSLNNMVIELTHHPREVYDAWKPLIERRLLSRNLGTTVPPFDYCLRQRLK
jgi:hypothetical protein